MKGFMGASVDRVNYFDNFAEVDVYLGKQQIWVSLNTDSIENKPLASIGFDAKKFKNNIFNITNLDQLKEKLLGYYENNGYPFATVYLDNIQAKEDSLSASIKLNKGPLYHIDSIRINGRVNISNYFLQRHLGIVNGSTYDKDKLEKVDLRIKELTFLESARPASLQMLGTGSILDLYLKPKKSSQVNFLIGVLPANNESNHLQLTGDINLNLKNEKYFIYYCCKC
jgi:outer membrane protein assembly factor BamA